MKKEIIKNIKKYEKKDKRNNKYFKKLEKKKTIKRRKIDLEIKNNNIEELMNKKDEKIRKLKEKNIIFLYS